MYLINIIHLLERFREQQNVNHNFVAQQVNLNRIFNLNAEQIDK